MLTSIAIILILGLLVGWLFSKIKLPSLLGMIKDGGGFVDLLNSYNILTGNTWLLVVLSALVSPVLVMKIRRER